MTRDPIQGNLRAILASSALARHHLTPRESRGLAPEACDHRVRSKAKPAPAHDAPLQSPKPEQEVK